MPNTPAQRALLDAIRANDVRAVQAALEQGANPDFASARSRLPLGLALYCQNQQIPEVLLDAGARLDRWDRGIPLMEWVVAANHGPLLNRCLAAGVCPTYGAILHASSHGNAEVVRRLLLAGAPVYPTASDFEEPPITHARPVLSAWPHEKLPPPPELIAASVGQSGPPAILDRVLSDTIARRDCHQFIALTQAAWFPLRSRRTLEVVINADWTEGLSWLLARGHCPPTPTAPGDLSPLVAAARRVQVAKSRTQAMGRLDALLAHGFDPCDTSTSYSSFSPFCPSGIMPEPAALSALDYSSPSSRRKLIKRLFTAPAAWELRYGSNGRPCEGGGLAHQLIVQDDWATLSAVLRKKPVVFWESARRPSLLSVVLRCPLTDQTEGHLRWLMQQGACVHSPSADGQSVLRTTLELLQPHPLTSSRSRVSVDTVFSLWCFLLKHGADPMQVDTDGHCAFDRLESILGADQPSITPWTALFAQHALQSVTVSPTHPPSTTPGPRL